MSLKYVLFDLDGTLTDPALGITNCVMYALERFNIHPATREEIFPYIGPPLIDSFMRFHGLSYEQALQAVVYYRERFSVDGWRENEVFRGTAMLLSELKAKGCTLIVATSKPEEFANRILRHFELAQYFDFVAGSTLSGLRPTKESVVAYVRERYPSIHGANTVMVGDRRYDVLGAHSQDLPAVGVLFGYGNREELEQANAEYIAENMQELSDLLISLI